MLELIYTIAFYALSLMLVMSALGVLFMRNIFHAGLSLLFALFVMAGLFILLGAEFVAGIQVVDFTSRVRARQQARSAIAKGTEAQLEDIKASRAALRDQVAAFAKLLTVLVSAAGSRRKAMENVLGFGCSSVRECPLTRSPTRSRPPCSSSSTWPPQTGSRSGKCPSRLRR